MLLHTQIDLQYLSSSPLQPGRHWVADSLSASRESHPSEDLSEPFPGVPLSSWLSSPTWEAVSWSVTGFSLSLPYFRRVNAYLTSGYHQDWCLSACIFSFQCSAEVSEKDPSTYINWEGRFLHHFGAVFEKSLRKFVFCRIMLTEITIFDVLLWFLWSDHPLRPCTCHVL